MSIPNLSDVHDHVGQLKALRDILAFHIDDCDSKRDLASLSLRYMDVVQRLREICPDESDKLNDTASALAAVVNIS